MSHLEVNQSAPAIETLDSQGNHFSLESLKGKKVILYFYPKDNTPGCTAEACNLRDNYSKLRMLGFEIIGISPDNKTSHQKFSEKLNLPFLLLPDVDKKIMNDYRVYGEKKMYGKTVVGVLRTTFIINEEGKIEKIISKVDTKNHSEQILKELNMNKM